MKPLPLVTAVVGLLIVIFASLCLGKYPLPPGEIGAFLRAEWFGGAALPPDRTELLRNLLLEIRLPRILAAALIGAALAVSGAAYQAMFVNPLVSPALLGVLAGASCGAALGMVLFKSWYAVQCATFLGGIAAVALAVGLARIYRIGGTIMLVLGGVISGALFSALLSLVKYLADPYNQLPAIVYWLMGNLSLADRAMVFRTGVPMLAGVAVLILSARYLNILSMGDEEAAALGVNVARVRLTVITAATLVSALTVVVAGAVGWVGLIIPHIARMVAGPDNETLLPVAALLGAGYLVAVDDVARLAFAFELPIGIVTALVGIPFFMLVLGNARKGWR
ncbi:iron ABC transporter permease [Geotalea uraniireducens]|uniref:Iron ABC transporter permease n=1 Tax=Geotalea uraniireducens TaxID=351604 RepID=A0ABM8EJL1_9BACT|nr:iron ABC transporter permease [Geotalea uraniireducens]BDV42192.1 iron ABC transporter permease [Geotalea uraniireducens]